MELRRLYVVSLSLALVRSRHYRGVVEVRHGLAHVQGVTELGMSVSYSTLMSGIPLFIFFVISVVILPYVSLEVYVSHVNTIVISVLSTHSHCKFTIFVYICVFWITGPRQPSCPFLASALQSHPAIILLIIGRLTITPWGMPSLNSWLSYCISMTLPTH